jgi:NitT/TauT family transport system permease protein
MKQFITSHDLVKKIAVILFWFATWKVVADFVNQPLYVPSPGETIASLFTLVVTKKFWLSILFTLFRVFRGLFFSISFGVLLAVLASRYRFVYDLMEPMITIFKTIPVMSMIILALVWLKSDQVPILVCFLLCFPIIYTNVITGIENIDQSILEMAQIYQINRKKRFMKIIIPSVKPYLISGMLVCVGLAWKSIVAAEVLASPRYSMGYNLYTTKLYLNTAELFAWTIIIILFSLLIEKSIKGLFSKKTKNGM